ncbi:MAG: P27 family phage terminase small subunit [Oscillospiraceae bacterium]|nr:P27 family phage terminase small subunit [Oscillospiraceae bacterium]
MAKDGTRRGGARAGAGRKPKALTEKLKEGRSAEIMLEPVGLFPEDENPELSGLPPLSDFLTEEQKAAVPLESKAIYAEVFQWLKSRGCENLVSHLLIEQYVMSVARWIQCEKALSASGFLARHPTTSGTIASPYVQMSQAYMKQINSLWYQIYQIVKENSSGEFHSRSDPMEQLLSM